MVTDVIKTLAVTCLLIIAAPAVAAPTVFVNVNVISMLEPEVLSAQTVIVVDGRIVAIGAVDETAVPRDAEIVDGTDRYLLPGLADMHAHVPRGNSVDLERVLTLFAANGVTLIRGMLGHPSHLGLRERLSGDAMFGPRLVTSGPSLNGNSVTGATDAARQVREQVAAGYDFIKVHPGLSQAEFGAIADAAQDLDIPFAGHVPVAVGLGNALAAGITTIDHLDGYLAALVPADADPTGGYGGFFDVLLAAAASEQQISELAGLTAAAGTWNVPTQSLFEHRVGPHTATELAARPEMRYMSPDVVERWVAAKERQEAELSPDNAVAARAVELRRGLILALHRAGAGLLLGSDAPQVFNVPGFSAHRELELLVAAGLTPYEALLTGTRSVATFLDTNGGVIAEGRDADLILLDANPLEDISNSRRIHGVMLRGRWYGASALADRLEALVAPPDRM